MTRLIKKVRVAYNDGTTTGGTSQGDAFEMDYNSLNEQHDGVKSITFSVDEQVIGTVYFFQEHNPLQNLGRVK